MDSQNEKLADATNIAETGSITTNAESSANGAGKGPIVNMTTLPEESFFAYDAFTVAAGHDGEHVDFRSMGWLKAGLVATAEVRRKLLRRRVFIWR